METKVQQGMFLSFQTTLFICYKSTTSKKLTYHTHTAATNCTYSGPFLPEGSHRSFPMFLCWILFPVLRSLHFFRAGRGQACLHIWQSDCLAADKQIQKRYWVSSVNHQSLSEVLTLHKHFAIFFSYPASSYKLGGPTNSMFADLSHTSLSKGVYL